MNSYFVYSFISLCGISLFTYLIVCQQIIDAKITKIDEKSFNKSIYDRRTKDDRINLNATQSASFRPNEVAIIIPYRFKYYRLDKTYNSNPSNRLLDDAMNLTSSHAFYKINQIENRCNLDITFGDIVCVECDIFTKKKKRKYQCDGVGEWMHESRFNDIEYTCNGKWLKLTPELNGNCTDSFSYVFM